MTVTEIDFDGNGKLIIPDKGLPQFKHRIWGHRFGSAWDWVCCDLIDEHLKDGMCFLDIGANIGAYSVLAARRTSGSIFAYEPHPENFRLLCKNLAPYPHAHLFQQALGDKNGFYRLALTPENHGGHILRYEATSEPCFAVSVSMLDDWNIAPDTVKIDVEGTGLQVLEGGIETLDKANLIMMEIHEIDSLSDSYTHEADSKELLQELGFIVNEIEQIRIMNKCVWRRLEGFIAHKGENPLKSIEAKLRGDSGFVQYNHQS